MKISKIWASPVVVPTHPDAVQSKTIQEDDWSQCKDADHFATASHKKAGTQSALSEQKYILQAETDVGICGIGETYRDPISVEQLNANAEKLKAQPMEALSLAHLPLPYNREYDGFELLVYDLVGKKNEVPVHQLLGGLYRDKIACSAWSGRRSPEEAGEVARKAFEQGYDCIKFKCNQQDDVLAWAQRIQESCKGKMNIFLDPNQRWGSVADARKKIEALGDYPVVLVEDPIERSDYAGFKALRGINRIQIVKHVALPYHAHGQRATDALEALTHDAVDGFNFNGSMAQFMLLSGMAGLAGKPCWHGSEVDLGILEAGYVHACAASPACTWPSDIFGRTIREHDLLAEPLAFEGKFIAVPQKPGLGVALDLQVLEAYRAGPDIELGS